MVRTPSSSSSGTRAVAALLGAVLALGTSPLVGSAAAQAVPSPSPPTVVSAPVLKSTDPAAGSTVSTTGSSTTVSATYDVPLHASSTLVLHDSPADHEVEGKAVVDKTKISFTTSPKLADGLWKVTVVAVNALDTSRKTTSTYSFTVDNRVPVPDTTPPAVPTLTSPTLIELADGHRAQQAANGENADRYLVEGAVVGEDSGLIKLVVDDSGIGAELTDPLVADVPFDDGGFSFTTKLSRFTEGDLTFALRAVDVAGNKSEPLTFTVLKDTKAPEAPKFDAVPSSVTTDSFAVTGTAEQGSTVNLKVDDSDLDTEPGTDDGGGPLSGTTFASNLSVAQLLDGPITLTATATDGAGNESSARTASSVLNRTALAFSGSLPAGGAPKDPPVDSAQRIVITFTEPVDLASNDSRITLKNAFGTPLAGTLSQAEPNTLVLEPRSTLDKVGSPYTVFYKAREARLPKAETAEGTFSFRVDRDRDSDGVDSQVDNCAGTANPDQADLDGDTVGDACDDVADVHNGGELYPFVRALLHAGITKGCSAPGAPFRFCPNSGVVRGHMSMFLARAQLGPDAAAGLPAYNGGFADVDAADDYANHVRWLDENRITDGCGEMRFCPTDAVTRAQLAVFLARTRLGRDAAANLPDYAGEFSDVRAGEYYATSVKWAKDEKITHGCGGTRYCPDDVVTRAQMARFLVRAFALPLPA